jgi:hypothetical protein
LDVVILQVRRLEEQLRTLYKEHQDFVEIELPRLTLEAVARAEQTSSQERIERLGLVVVRSVLRGPSADSELPIEMLRVSVELSAADVQVLAQIYSVQGDELARTGFLPEENLSAELNREYSNKPAVQNVRSSAETPAGEDSSTSCYFSGLPIRTGFSVLSSGN